MTISRYPTLKSLLLAATILASPLTVWAPTLAQAEVTLGISVQLAPPVLPVYDQPPMPEAGYIWTPGYWAYADPTGYYWVPGTWVQPPTVGYLWTPPYWGWVNGAYLFNEGYWGPHVGFYGGINYGFGYGGRGYDGGRWDHGGFVYNRAANNFGETHVTNSYTQNVTVINRTHVSYVGGTGGTRAQPTTAERAAAHETHAPVTADQTRHVDTARGNPDFAAAHNNGKPAIAATSRPAQFEGPAVTHVRAAPGPAIQPRPAAGQAAQPRTDQHPAAAQAAQPRPAQHPTAAQATQPRPAQHPAVAQAVPPRTQHPEAEKAAPPRPPQPAATTHTVQPHEAQPPAEPEKEKKQD